MKLRAYIELASREGKASMGMLEPFPNAQCITIKPCLIEKSNGHHLQCKRLRKSSHEV